MKDGQIAQIGTADEIILQPANDYVAEFVSDVPLGRALTVGSVMKPVSIATNGVPTINREKSLDEACSLFQEGVDLVQVEDRGQIVGVVTARELVLAMAKSAT